jgi:hypothetical protein
VFIWALALGLLLFFLTCSWDHNSIVIKARGTNCVVALAGKFCSRLWFEKRSSLDPWIVWEREGLKETRPLWPPQRGVGLQEPNLGKTNLRVSLAYSLGICFAPSLSDSFIFLTLTRLVVVFIFVNFSFALFTPPSRRLSVTYAHLSKCKLATFLTLYLLCFVLASITKRGEIEREMALIVFYNWFWCLTTITNIMD